MNVSTFKTLTTLRSHFERVFMNYSIHDANKPYDFTLQKVELVHEKVIKPEVTLMFGQYGDYFIIGELLENDTPFFIDVAADEGHTDELPDYVQHMLVAAAKAGVVPTALLEIIIKWRGIVDTSNMDINTFFGDECAKGLKDLEVAAQ